MLLAPLPTVRTLRLRVKDKHAALLRAQAREVNFVWNYCNETALKILEREHRFCSNADLDKLTTGATKEGLSLHSQTVQAISAELVTRRRQFKKRRLAWRKSGGARRSLGWIPFKAAALSYKAGQVRYQGQPISLWDSYGLSAYELGPGSFAEDSTGRWFLNIQVSVPFKPCASSDKVQALDLGCKTAATPATGAPFEAKFYHALEAKLAVAQRAGKKARAKAISAKIKHRRKDALHKFTTALVNEYGAIFIGDVSSAWQTASGNGKSVLDAGWGLLKTQLLYKGEHAGKWVEVVDEAYSTQTCSHCGERTGPKGREELAVREWVCAACGTHHQRDVNAAKNILAYGLIGVEARVAAARLEREAKHAKTLERKTKLAANKAAKAAAAGRGRLAEGTPSCCGSGITGL